MERPSKNKERTCNTLSSSLVLTSKEAQSVGMYFNAFQHIILSFYYLNFVLFKKIMYFFPKSGKSFRIVLFIFLCGAGIGISMSLFDGLGMYIFCRKIEKTQPIKEEKWMESCLFPAGVGIVFCVYKIVVLVFPTCTFNWLDCFLDFSLKKRCKKEKWKYHFLESFFYCNKKLTVYSATSCCLKELHFVVFSRFFQKPNK